MFQDDSQHAYLDRIASGSTDAPRTLNSYIAAWDGDATVSSVVIAASILRKLKCPTLAIEVLTPLLSAHVTSERRKNVRRSENAHAGGFNPDDFRPRPPKGRPLPNGDKIRDQRSRDFQAEALHPGILAVLDAKFRAESIALEYNGKVHVTWGAATVAQHRHRAEWMQTKVVDAIQVTIDRHRAVAGWLEHYDVANLDEMADKLLPAA